MDGLQYNLKFAKKYYLLQCLATTAPKPFTHFVLSCLVWDELTNDWLKVTLVCDFLLHRRKLLFHRKSPLPMET